MILSDLSRADDGDGDEQEKEDEEEEEVTSNSSFSLSLKLSCPGFLNTATENFFHLMSWKESKRVVAISYSLATADQTGGQAFDAA